MGGDAALPGAPAAAPPPVAVVECEMMRNGLAAFAASATATVPLHPLDTLKVRLQSDAYSVRPAVAAESDGGDTAHGKRELRR